MDTWNIMLSVLTGAIGLGYIVYGRSQMRGMPLVSGIALCIFPYFVSSIWLTLLIAAVLMALPRFIDF